MCLRAFYALFFMHPKRFLFLFVEIAHPEVIADSCSFFCFFLAWTISFSLYVLRISLSIVCWFPELIIFLYLPRNHCELSSDYWCFVLFFSCSLQFRFVIDVFSYQNNRFVFFLVSRMFCRRCSIDFQNYCLRVFEFESLQIHTKINFFCFFHFTFACIFNLSSLSLFLIIDL